MSFKEMLLKIDIIEEMRTTCSNKQVPQTFFHNYFNMQQYDLICLTTYHWQPCILQFCDITKGVN